MAYAQEKAQHYSANEVPAGDTVLDIGGTKVRRRLREGIDSPEWFSFAQIAPYTATRRAMRETTEAFGAFIEIHLARRVTECERRDRRCLYKVGRPGKIKEFTCISGPYKVHTKAELVADAKTVGLDHCAHQVILKLVSMRLIRG